MPSQDIINRLQEVKKHILENPNRLVMSEWFLQDSPGTLVIDVYTNKQYTQQFPSCGTVGCIQGWMQHFQNTKNPLIDIKLSLEEELITDELYYVEYWHNPYRQRYMVSKTVEEKAQVCAEYIDYVCTGAIDISKEEINNN